MAKAGWGAARQELPVGNYLAQVIECAPAKVKDLKNPGKFVEKFKFTVDVQVDGAWETRTIYTAMNFTDESQADDPQFISGLNKITRACGLKVPETLEEAEAFDTDMLEGRRFVWSVQQDEETHKVVRKFLRLKAKPTAAPAEPPAEAPAEATPAPRGSEARVAAGAAEGAPSYAAATEVQASPSRKAAAAASGSPARNSRPTGDNDPFA